MPLEGSEVFHRRERVFFSFLLASERKTDEVKEFTIGERTVKVCLLHFRLEYLRKCVTDRIYSQVGVIWLNAFTGFSDRDSWSSFAWWFHRNIFFVQFSQSKVLEEVNNFFFWDKGCLSRVAFLYPREGTWACNRVGTPPDITKARHLNDFTRSSNLKV